jgi:hypothetical protein
MKRGWVVGGSHVAGGAGDGRRGPAQRLGGVGRSAPARSPRAWADIVPRCKTEVAWWLPGQGGASGTVLGGGG